MLINTSGVAIRINVSDISVTSRSTMGVTLMRTTEEEKIAAITKISGSIDDKEEQLTLDSEDINDEVKSEIAVVNDSDNSLNELLDRSEE